MMANVEMKPLIEAVLAKFGGGEEGIVAAIDLAVIVANADGKIDQAEREALEDSIAAVMGTRLAPNIARHLVRESRGQIEAVGIAERARGIGEALRLRDAVAEGLRIAFAVAYASEGLSEEERSRIGAVAMAAGASDTLLDELARSMAPA